MPRVTRLEAAELFSIGLYVLHDDGTPVLNEAGEAVATYDNNDIMNFGAMMGARQTMIPPPARLVPHTCSRRAGRHLNLMVPRSLLAPCVGSEGVDRLHASAGACQFDAR